MLKSVPRDQWGEVRIKSSAIEGLTGRKPQYGLKRRWLGDYLSQADENSHNSLYQKQIKGIIRKHGEIIFSSFVRKANKHGKMEDRCVVITKKGLVKLTAKYKEMHYVPFASVMGVAVTNTGDNLVVVRVTGNDLVMCLYNNKKECRTGEFVGVLFNEYRVNRHQEVKIDVAPIIHCELGNKKKTIKAEKGRENSDGVPVITWETKNDMVVHCIIIPKY